MDSKIKAEWIAALRLGKYKQGKHVLHNIETDTYCCLGVLCAIRGLDAERYEDADRTATRYIYKGDSGSERLPNKFRQEIGLEMYENGEGTLVLMNDGGDTFDQIADWIEKHL